MARTSAGRKDGRRWLSGRCLFVRNVFAPRAAADVDRARAVTTGLATNRSALGAFLLMAVAAGSNSIAIKHLAR